MKILPIILLSCFCLTNLSSATEPTIFVQYRNKPPYSFTKDNKPAGFLLEHTIKIFELANVNAKYEEIPVKRIIFNVQKNLMPICSPGWYKIPEREEFAQFTNPIHQDEPHVVLAGIHLSEKLKTIKTLKELLANPNLLLGKVSGVSYGSELDSMIKSAPQMPLDSTVTPFILAKMINGKRADYMLIDFEDYKFIKKNNPSDLKNVMMIKFPDMPNGLKRYIMCSTNISPEIIKRLNIAIKSLSLK